MGKRVIITFYIVFFLFFIHNSVYAVHMFVSEEIESGTGGNSVIIHEKDTVPKEIEQQIIKRQKEKKRVIVEREEMLVDSEDKGKIYGIRIVEESEKEITKKTKNTKKIFPNVFNYKNIIAMVFIILVIVAVRVLNQSLSNPPKN